MSQELNLWNRLTSKTPEFFKRVRAIAISIAATAAIVLSAPEMFPDFVIPPNMKKILVNICVAGFIAAGTAQTAKVDDKKVSKQE